VLRAWRDWTDQAPDELTTLANLLTAPPVPFLPEEWHGKPLIAIIAAYSGPSQDGERAIQPLREFAEPVADLMGPIPYMGLQTLIDPLYAPGSHNYMNAGFMSGLDDAAVDALIAAQASVTSPMSEIHVHHVGGAVARVAPDATAFGERDAPFLLNVVARTPGAEGYDAAVRWGREVRDSVGSVLTGGTYVNFATDDGQVRAAYGEKYDRLVALKDEYDPTNLFRLNQNIAPTAS
jgi:FAD/FMN-containing dehydrogenase